MKQHIDIHMALYIRRKEIKVYVIQNIYNGLLKALVHDIVPKFHKVVGQF